MNLTKISILRPTVVVVIFAALILGGIFSYRNLTYELLPNFSVPVITVTTTYPGAAPSEVENSLTKKVEDAISSLENIDDINSVSQESFSMVTVKLKAGTDVDLSLQDAQRRINAILSTLPEDAETPSLGKFDINDLPIIQLGLTSNMEATAFYDLLDQQIKPSFSQIPGVANVALQGGLQREIRVNVDVEKLKAYDLSILQVSQAITQANLDFPTGKVVDDREQVLIRLAGKFTTLDDIRDLVITDKDNSPVKVRDVAEVQDTEQEVKVLKRVNGVSAVGMIIKKQNDGNAVEISEEVMKLISKLESSYADKDLHFIEANDSSVFTLEAADAVIHDLVLAIIIVAFVMLLFLHSLRNAVIVMIAIPASLISTFIAMALLGFSLNLMSLLGLSLVVGILVDDAIVVLENIYRHMEMGKSRAQASLDAVKEIGATVVSITAVLIIVFVPIAMVQGLISDLLRQFSLVVAIATALSLFVSFSLIPLVSSRFSKLEHLTGKNLFEKFILWFERMIDKFGDFIHHVTVWAFRHAFVTIAVVVVMFFGSFALISGGFIGSEFASQGDRGEFNLNIELSKDASVEENNRVTQQIESYLFSLPEVETVTTTVGTTSTAAEGQSTAYESEIAVAIIPASERTVSSDIYANRIKNELEARIPGIKIRPVPVRLTGGASDAPIQVNIQGADFEEIMEFSGQALEIVQKIDGISDAKLSVESGNPEIGVTVDRTKMASLGLTINQVGATLQTAFNGTENQDIKYRDGDFEYNINVILDQIDRRSISDIANLSIVNSHGELIKLSQFADVSQSTGPSRLERTNRMNSVTVEAMVVGRPTGTVGAEIQQQMEQVEIPKGINIEYKGDLENQSEAFGSLGFALITSIILVYLVMVLLYNSYVHPFVVLFSIPLAVIGALLALALTQQTMNIFSMLGMIMLIGLVAKNAILVVDFTNDLREMGHRTTRALLEAIRIRLRPILMTTLAMIFGMLPIALANGPGAEWKNGLAWALIGGLTSSMFLTLVVVPVIYLMFDKVLVRLGLNKKTEIALEDKSKEQLEQELAHTAIA